MPKYFVSVYGNFLVKVSNMMHAAALLGGVTFLGSAFSYKFRLFDVNVMWKFICVKRTVRTRVWVLVFVELIGCFFFVLFVLVSQLAVNLKSWLIYKIIVFIRNLLKKLSYLSWRNFDKSVSFDMILMKFLTIISHWQERGKYTVSLNCVIK